jgi:ubiquinone/menaquinone biosynthesis C-methylase UbiE
MTQAATQALSALEAYELWADTYAPEPHNPLMAAEQEAMVALLPDVRGRRILDLACGTGRYSRLMAAAQASHVVALDVSPAMLRRVTAGARVQASMDRLPFANCSFDVVISGLALGHAPDVALWMHEGARVLAPGGTLLYSDFHPVASQRGLNRTFKDRSGRRHTVAQFCHSIEAQRLAAGAAGLTLEFVRELRAGIEFLEPFPGAQEFYQRQYGTPLVLIVRASRQAT